MKFLEVNILIINAKVSGLTCASCAEKIRESIEKLDGVKSTDLSLINEKLRIEVDEDTDINQIKNSAQKIADRIEKGTVFNFESGSDSEHYAEMKSGAVNSVIDDDDDDELKEMMIRLLLSGFFFALSFIFKDTQNVYLALNLTAYTIIGGDIVISAINKVSKGQMFDEEFLMTLATFAAIFIGEYQEAVAVMLFYQFGELLQDRAVMKSRRSLKEVVSLKADYANLKTDSGYQKVNPESVKVGDIILVKPGENVPLDGVLVKGSSRVNTSALTGEPVPVGVNAGDGVLAGYINETNTIEIEVEKEYRDSAVSKIMDLVENAESKKAPTEKFITKFAKIYTPTVSIIAVIIAFVVPLVLRADLNDWLYRAAIFLVIACPCALVVSVPLGFFGGIGAFSRNGILVKGGNYLEALSNTNHIIMDKTGTLTKGVFKVQDILTPGNYDKNTVLEYAAIAESYSNHPIAKSIVEEYGKEINHDRVEEHEEIAGHGIRAVIDDRIILVGNKKLFDKYDVGYSKISEYSEEIFSGTEVLVSIDGDFSGKINIADEIKDDAKSAIEGLKTMGIDNIEMLTGDSNDVAEQVSRQLGIPKFHGGLLPEDKLRIFEEIYSDKKPKETVAFVGDGINDAPTLARADVGIAMGALGTDAAIEAADVVIMTDEPSKIVQSIRISKKVKSIVTQNIVFALGIKFAVLLLGVMGEATMWEAVFADVGVSVLAVMNSVRALRAK